MEKSQNKVLRHGSGYTRLHGAPNSPTLKSSSSAPSFSQTPSNRHRVHFDDNAVDSADYLSFKGNNSAALPHNRKFPEVKHEQLDPDLVNAMRHYGLDNSNIEDYSSVSYSHKPPDHIEHNQRLISFGVSLCSGLSNLILAYPCVVLKRQCQINQAGKKYHMTPFTIFGLALNLQRAQGITCLWKGIGSCVCLNATTVGIECGISELSSGKLPRDITISSSFYSVCSHLSLKNLTTVIATPFFLAHLVESVQSEMVCEKPTLMSYIYAALGRMFGRKQTPRLLPLYQLLLPNVTHTLLRYILSSALQQLILHLWRWNAHRQHEKRMISLQPSSPLYQEPSSVPSSHSEISNTSSPSKEKNMQKSFTNTLYSDLLSGLIADLISEVILFPMETICNRINIQGTRTIIDNTDTGKGFLPVSSKYVGFWDCFSSTIASEGFSGLYRGFGALILQYTLKYAVVQSIKLTL